MIFISISEVVPSVQSATAETEDGIRIIHHTGEMFDEVRQAISHYRANPDGFRTITVDYTGDQHHGGSSAGHFVRIG
ncbi:hypothetical protein G9U52_20545 [Paenibacillus sp. S3N08]|uniref:Uncharacterized protein n=1 Tax=Paenibacillus agricola TaxID=2716264 RepID=A0ABX0J7A0_9BACL|nr:hypothetical protein [Paenibacillus agricola]